MGISCLLSTGRMHMSTEIVCPLAVVKDRVTAILLLRIMACIEETGWQQAC